MTTTTAAARTPSRSRVEAHAGTSDKVLSGFRTDRYGKHHHDSIRLMDGYFEKVQRQEDLYVEAGLPLEGMTDFLQRWFHAWEQRSIELFRECLTDDMVYADPSGGSVLWTANERELLSLYHVVWKLLPDFVFYPQDDGQAGLPTYDFLDGIVRVTVPWRGIGKPIIGRRLDWIGVDRYVMERHPERGWLIQRIDTDLDMLFNGIQALPIRIRAPKQRTLHRAIGILNTIVPATKAPKVRPFVHK